MSSIVLKFGGAALSSSESFDQIAKIICRKRERRIVVVVSAMGSMTDELLTLAHSVNPQPPKRELDMLLSVGERISMSLLAMALAKEGRSALSFTGSQSGIITTGDHSNAEILEVRPHRILEALQSNAIAIVAGFQGVSLQKEITTLGRGGSDTSAVALGAAVGATHVEFYKDVGGVFSADPKKDPDAKLISQLTFKDAMHVAKNILHPRSILLASKNDLPLHVLPFNGNGIGTEISNSFEDASSPRSYR
ncbi:MAG: Aspartokinase [Chlamydiia bacterium]|nr:Aspartokinase [Chlamydiia bacterium]MCH9615170.1 Aspartokinase [Chlamydiia bacterium]MCH9628508.1 Aspartokinase [Chlamydiia bacterium]